MQNSHHHRFKLPKNEPTLVRKTQYRSGKTMYLSFFWKNPHIIAIALILNLLSVFTQLLPSILIGSALDELNTQGFSNTFAMICMMIVVSAIFNVFFSYYAGYLFGLSAFRFERDIRQRYFDTIQNHSMTFHNEFNSSRLLSMGTNEITQLRMGLHPSMRMITSAFFSMSMTMIVLYQIVPIYGLIALMLFILYVILAYRYARRIAPIRMKLADELGALTEVSQEIFRGIEVVRGTNSSNKENEKFKYQSSQYADLSCREGRMSAFYLPAFLLISLIVIIFYLSLNDVLKGIITIGQLTQAVSILFQLQFLNFMLPMVLLTVQAALVNSDRIWKILNWKDPQPDDAKALVSTINWKSDIIFDSVTFSYNKQGKSALSCIKVKIPRGFRVALIGGPGSGKSTFLKLLLRLYDPQKGSILIDQQKFAEIPATEIRHHISMVEQEIFLFSATIKDNISFSRPDASVEEIIAAAQAAQAAEFIEEMPQKYDTYIGERGVTLSGGQRQRLAIARAILANPEIMLLDDSVSAIDSKTEMVIRKALDNLLKGRTSVTVTQRLNTLVRADMIILLDRGEILAVGKHQELLECCPPYRRIFELLPEEEKYSGDNSGGMS